MTQCEKLFERIKNNPKNVSFEDLAKLLEYYGFTYRKQTSGTSHYYFSKEGCEPFTIPKHKPVKSVYVRRALARIEACGEPEENDNS
jgi:hypothetical protein